MIKPVSFRWSTELVARIDLRRGDVPRSVWVRRAVEVALARADGSLRVAAEREVAEKFGLHPPAEQPDALERVDEILREAAVSGIGGRVSPSKPIPPRVPFRRDVKPFQRGDK